ncbi:MAG TPA: S-(hydroxymethyl)mycothiol dehydrogenase [Acidimicrobiales bacterium]|nr:S-(hydroxymethyl)mycothiol dehydrogenase [Acidimicrobiales bacterium]
MAHEVRGVIARGKGEPVELTTVVVPDPGPGEALVDVRACGVCHTDLHYREGGITDDFPFLLGHEAAGVVEVVGDGVTDVAPGDFVVLNWRAVCGQCRACRKGRPHLCFATHNASQKMALADGITLSPALGIGAFADKTLVAAGQCTPVDPAAPPEVAGLLGCGVMAGLGAAVLTGNVQRGDTVAVFGCGGVGDAAIAGAKLAGATTIVAVDLDDRKLEWARGFGATHTVNAGSTDAVEAVCEATGGFGADVCIEAVGHPKVLEQAFYARDLAGTVVQVGVPTPDMRFPDIPMIDFFGRGGALKPSWYGDCLPSRDFPLLIDLHLQGRLPLDAFVSETIGLDGIEEAFQKMERGEVLRSVVVLADEDEAAAEAVTPGEPGAP